jgi:hypothetical protein
MDKDSDLMHCKDCAYSIKCGEKDCRDYKLYKSFKEREALMKKVTEIIFNQSNCPDPPQIPSLGRKIELGAYF